MHWSYRGRSLTQNTWEKTKHIYVDFDSNGLLFLFFFISGKYLQFRKKKQKHLLWKIFGSLYTSNPIYLLRNCVFKLYVSQRYVQNLERSLNRR